MNKVLFFLGGLVVGGAAGTGATYLVLKKREDKIINEELEKISKETTEYKHDIFADGGEADDRQNEEKPIPELAEMANKVKTEEGEKTDYTGFSKSEEEKEEPKKPIEYVGEEKADELITENNYELIDMDYYQDGILLYDGPTGDYAKTTPEDIGVDMSKAQNDELYAVDHTKQKIYLISISNQNYDDEEEENEYDGEQSES